MDSSPSRYISLKSLELSEQNLILIQFENTKK
jgi:hypothetical protein